MNQDQVMVLIRTILMMFAPLLVEHGIVSSDAIAGLEGAIIAFVGAALALGSLVWGIWVQSHSSKIAAVNAIDGVKVVSQSTPAPMVTTAPKS